MAKGRKHGLLHPERLLRSFSYGHGHPAAAAADLPDLGEEDVWYPMATDDVGGDGEASGEDAWYRDAGRRPSVGGSGGGGGARAHNHRPVGGLSLAFDGAPTRVVHQCRNADSSTSLGGGGRHRHVAASAPVSVPVWPGGHRADPADSPPGDADECDSGEWIPPHEYLAREYAAVGGGRSAAGSVFEGVGRTLKGRDLRRLRDAVWSQTGFFG